MRENQITKLLYIELCGRRAVLEAAFVVILLQKPVAYFGANPITIEEVR